MPFAGMIDIRGKQFIEVVERGRSTHRFSSSWGQSRGYFNFLHQLLPQSDHRVLFKWKFGSLFCGKIASIVDSFSSYGT